MVVLGLLLGMVGTDVYTGAPRFTMGMNQFADGLNFVAVAVGVFGIAEILRNLEDEHDRQVMTKNITRLLPNRDEFRQMIGPVLRGTGIGSVLGILPGGGAILASFASYTIEKKVSKNPEEFGKGALAGVAGPESANNAGAQTSFIPLLTLGIPANPVMALMIGAMIIQGIVPGPNVVTEQPALFWGIIASMWIGNLMLVVLNLPLIGMWVKLLTVPYYVLFPIIMAMCSIGVYSVATNTFDLFAVAFFGLLGYVMSKLRCEPAPLLLGFVLGPMLEEHLRRAVSVQHGDPGSVLNFTRGFLRWRREHPALVTGDIRFLDAPEPVIAFVRSGGGEEVLAAFNLGGEPAAIEAPGGVEALSGHGLDGTLDGGRIRLPGHGAFLGRLSGTDNNTTGG